MTASPQGHGNELELSAVCGAHLCRPRRPGLLDCHTLRSAILHWQGCRGHGWRHHLTKRFTSDMAFGQEATIEVRDVDRYGRLVAGVHVSGEPSTTSNALRSDTRQGGNDG
jgi:hypothetical protein